MLAGGEYFFFSLPLDHNDLRRLQSRALDHESLFAMLYT